MEVDSLKEGEWFCYRGGLFNGEELVMLEVASLMEGEWSCYRGGQFNGGKNSHVTEVITNGGKMVMLQRWKV